MSRAPAAAVALTVGALALVGCGGSSKTGSASTAVSTKAANAAASPTLTTVKIAQGKSLRHATWIANGDVICERTRTKLRTISFRSEADLIRQLPEIAIYNSKEATDLSKLIPPALMAHDWTQIIADLQIYSDYMSGAGRYYQAKHQSSAAHLIEKSETVQNRLIAIAKRDGFKRCSLPN